MTRQEMEEWTAALEGGEYKQGKSKLRWFDDTYCCLGVKCDLDDKSMWTLSEDGDYYTWNGSSAFLIPINDDIFIENGINVYNLMVMNDGGFSFSEIAAYIRENYKETV